ncbi:hypothetical protein GCM10029976_066730 [Kribbella albertanoniae]
MRPLPGTFGADRVAAKHLADRGAGRGHKRGELRRGSHVCNPRDGSEAARCTDALEKRFHESWSTLTFRTPAEITSLLPGLELVGSGLVPLYQWHAPDSDEVFEDTDRHADASYILYAAGARKP